VYHPEEVKQRGLVRFVRGDEDAQADSEEVDLRGEGVSAFGGDDALAEFPECGEDV
jgi:hypothetical protein